MAIIYPSDALMQFIIINAIPRCACIQDPISYLCRPFDNIDCALDKCLKITTNINIIHEIRSMQLIIIKHQWKKSKVYDKRSELLLGAIYNDIRNNLYPKFNGFSSKYSEASDILLGSGANGRIYPCKRTSDGKIVIFINISPNPQMALKIRLQLSCSTINEIQMLKFCYNKRYTIKLYDSYFDNNVAIMITQLDGHQWIPSIYQTESQLLLKRVNGRDLSAFIKCRLITNESELLKIIYQLLRIMYYMHHEKLLCHNDIKPSNFIIDKSLNVKLIDMASCKDISKSCIFQRFSGTVSFSSPETVKNISKNIPYNGIKNDLWGLGMTIYRCCFGNDLEFSSDKCPQSFVCPVSVKTEKQIHYMLNLLFNNNDTSIDPKKMFRALIKQWPIPESENRNWFLWLRK